MMQYSLTHFILLANVLHNLQKSICSSFDFNLYLLNKMVQPLLRLDELWSWASTSVVGLPVAIAFPVSEAKA